jgi:hypothetical protein
MARFLPKEQRQICVSEVEGETSNQLLELRCFLQGFRWKNVRGNYQPDEQIRIWMIFSGARATFARCPAETKQRLRQPEVSLH